MVCLPGPQGLQLALACLNFDFVGTCLDDSTEDLTTIQVKQLQHQGPTRGGSPSSRGSAAGA